MFLVTWPLVICEKWLNKCISVESNKGRKTFTLDVETEKETRQVKGRLTVVVFVFKSMWVETTQFPQTLKTQTTFLLQLSHTGFLQKAKRSVAVNQEKNGMSSEKVTNDSVYKPGQVSIQYCMHI